MAKGSPNWVKGMKQPPRKTGAEIASAIKEWNKPQPVLEAGHIERPPETPNPMDNSREPFSFPTGRDRPLPSPAYESTTPRRVVEAEIDDLLDWGLPRFRLRYPRATADSVRPMLIMALRSNKFCFLRTANACGLFVAEVTPWEPELTVQDVFVVARARKRDEEDESPTYWGRKEAMNIYKAAMRWAIDIGAVEFNYGVSTGVDLEPLAAEVGYDLRSVGYTKKISEAMREAQRAA